MKMTPTVPHRYDIESGCVGSLPVARQAHHALVRRPAKGRESLDPRRRTERLGGSPKFVRAIGLRFGHLDDDAQLTVGKDEALQVCLGAAW
jgi:hypothetical protein